MRPGGLPSNFTQAWRVKDGLLVSNWSLVLGSLTWKYWPASKWMAVSPAWPEGESVTNVGGLAGLPGVPTRLLIPSVILVPEPSLNSKSISAVAAEVLAVKDITAVIT